MHAPFFAVLLLLRSPTAKNSRLASSLHVDGLSISERLLNSLSNDDQEKIQFKGYVSSKRSFGNSLAFVDLVTHPELEICQALLRREFYEGPHYQGYRRCMLPGAHVLLEGAAAPTKNPGEAVLLIHNMRLLEVPRQPQHIRAILSVAAAGELPMEEIAEASLLSVDALENSLIQQQESHKPYHALAKAIFLALPPRSKELEQHIAKERSVSHRKVDPPSQTSMDISLVTETLSVDEVKKLSCPIAVATMGLVQNRRRFENNVTVVNLVDEDEVTPLSKETDDIELSGVKRLECILHPDVIATAEMYGNLLTVGSRVWVSGVLVASQEKGRSSTLWVKEARLVRASWRPITLRYVLDLLHEGRLSAEEAAEALQISSPEAEQLSELEDLTARQWKANQLSVKLQSSESRTANLSPEILQVLDQYSHLRTTWPLLPPPAPQLDTGSSLQQGLPGSKWQRKKRPQLEWMVKEIAEVAKSHPAYGKRTLHILDVGGGKGKLANYLAQSLGDNVQVHVVDIAQGAVANGAMQAKRLKLSVNYQVADASTTQFLEHPIDMVVALHACGHLSDVALAHAVQHKAGFVICPCCFLSNPGLRIPGTGEAVQDFLSIPFAEWSALKQVAEVQGDSSLASLAIHTVCAVRAETVSRKSPNCSIQIKSFPIQYSTRNICLIGIVEDSS